MATIVTRASKGSALTWTEGDANITNLNNDKIELTDLSVGDSALASGSGAISYDNETGVFTYTPPDLSEYLTESTTELSEDTSPVLGGDLDVGENSITTSSSDEFIKIASTVKLTGGGKAIRFAGVFDYFGDDYVDLKAPDNVGGTVTLTLPNSTGTNGQVLTTDGNGALSFTTIESGIESVADDTEPALGGDLDGQGNTVSNIELADYSETIYSLGSTDSPTITIANGNVQSVTISSGLSLPAFADAAAGQSVTLLVSGSGTVSGTAAYKFAGGNTTLTTSSVISVFYDGTTYWASVATDFQ